MEDRRTSVPVNEDPLALLNAVSQRIGSSCDPGEVLNQVMDAAVQLTGAQRGFLVLVNGETGQLDWQAGYHVDREILAGQEMEIGRAVVKLVLAGGEPVLIGRGQPDSHPAEQSSVTGRPLGSIMGAPLWAGGKITGVVCVDRGAHGGIWEQDTLEALSALANQAALAIENARLNRALEAAAEAKATFVSTVSHELRVPMTAIKGYADMLRQGAAGPLTDLQRSFLDTIRRNVDRMSVLITDLSTVNRVESGRLTLKMELLDLAMLAGEAVAGLQDELAEKRQNVALELVPDLELVLGDRSCVVQILANLIRNASQYSPAGRPIVVNAERIEERGRAWVHLRVIDQGVGISEDDRPRLFSPFFRSEDPRVRQEPGWGLGLTLAKMLTEAQGGRVSVISEPNVGSIFGFTLPVAVE